MKTKLIPMMLLAGGCLFARTNFSIGVSVGAPGHFAPPVIAAVRPPCPGPGYTWVDGYREPDGDWVSGYWAAPAYVPAPYAYSRGWDRDDSRFRDRDGQRFRDRDDHDRGRGFEEGHRR